MSAENLRNIDVTAKPLRQWIGSEPHPPQTYRQGDVLLKKAHHIPPGFKKSDDPVLVQGETTGHAHRVTGQVQVFRGPRGMMYVSGKGMLMHEEHGPIPIDGIYEIQRQREYNPFEQRVVQD